MAEENQNLPSTSGTSATSEVKVDWRLFTINRRTGALIPTPADVIPDDEYSDEEERETVVAEVQTRTRHFTKPIHRKKAKVEEESKEVPNETSSEEEEEDYPPLSFERPTTCTGEPQMVQHGNHLTDLYQMHRHNICSKRMEERVTRIKGVEHNLPVPQLKEFTDDVLLEELNEKFGEMDMEESSCQLIFETYKKGRLEQVKKWIKEESYHRINLRLEGQSQSVSMKDFMNNLIPISKFTPQEYNMVEEISLEKIFPTKGAYHLDEVKSLNITGCKCEMDYFDLPRKPCIDEDCKKSRGSRPTLKTAPNDDTPNEYMDHLEKIEEWMRRFTLGITPSAFWTSYVNEHEIEEATLQATLGVSKLEQFCLMRPSLFHVPEKENPLKLMYPGYLSKSLKPPYTIFKEIWHDIKVIMGGYCSAETQDSVLTGDIKRMLELSSTALEIDPTDWGFANCEELCKFCISEYEPEVFKIITFTKNANNVGSTLMALTEMNEKKLDLEMNLLEQIEIDRLAAIPPPNRIRKLNELKKNNPMFMDKPEEIIRIPLTRGTKWACYPDHVEEGFPLELSVYPKVFKELADELHTLMMEKWSSPKYKYLRIQFNKKLPKPEKLVEGLHVVVQYRLASPRSSITDDSSPPKFQFHRGILIEYFVDEKQWLVELYDRGIAMLVDDDKMQLMSPEVYCHSPAMATRVRLQLSKDYKRAVETDFKAFCQFDETEVGFIEGLLDDAIPFDVVFLEEFPSDLCFDRFWKVSITSYYYEYALDERNNNALSNSRNATVILLNKMLRARIDEAYTEYCQDPSYIQLEQKYPAGSLKKEDVADHTEQKLEDFLALTDPMW